ncbi:MAG: Gfo/Idh/MocA family protein [Limisphaerales bacterium]
MKTITRRSFLKGTLLATASLGLPTRSWAAAGGANDDIRVAVIGFNGRGKDHIEGFRKVTGVRVVALCDADRNVLEREAKHFRDRNEPIETYTDVRKLLENKDIDAISTATPNHWHSLIGIWACQHGKDVYVEKPVSHNVSEGRKLVEAARKYNRIVQTGTQSRSSYGIKEMVEWVKAGNLGKILVSRGLCYKPRGSIGKVDGDQPVPPSVDYDLWIGPAAKVPLHRKHLHYDWHWVWNTGCGDVGNQGIHQMDIARWFLGETELSPRILSVGGRLGYVDDGETPNTQFVFHDYAKAPLIFEVRGLPSKKEYQADMSQWSRHMDKFPAEHGGSISVIVHCEGGHVLVPDYGGAEAYDKDGKQVKAFRGSVNHYDNFIKAVRSRNVKELNADILEGHLSSALCHTGNVSHRLGRQLPPDAIRDAIKSDPQATESFGRMTEHLAANGVDLNQTEATLGVFLKMDPRGERFIDNASANELLTRPYRKPFVVPAQV